MFVYWNSTIEADSGKHSTVLTAEVGDVEHDEEIDGAEFTIDHRGAANTCANAEIHIVKSGELNSLAAIVAY